MAASRSGGPGSLRGWYTRGLGTAWGIPLGGIPLGGIPLGGIIDLATIPGGGVGLNDIQLASIPNVDWSSVLAGSNLSGPIQTLTLQQVLGDPVAAPRFKALSLAQAGLGSTLLRSISTDAVLLGTLQLDRVPVPGGAPDWCAYLLSLNWAPARSCSDSTQGRNCRGANVDPGLNSVLGLDIAGAGIQDIPLGGIPLGGIPLGGIPLGGIPLGGIDVNATPLRAILLRDLPDPTKVVDCHRIDCSPSSTRTLGDAAALTPSAILASAHLTDLGTTINNIPLGGITAGLIGRSDLPWEKLAYDGTQDVAPVSAAGLHYHVTFDVPCGGASPQLSVQATTPSGFRYVAHSSSASINGSAAQALSEPAGASPALNDTPDVVTWTSFPTAACSGQATGSQHWVVNYQAQPGLDLGTFTSSATVNTPQATSVSGAAPVQVTQNWKPNSDPANAPIVQADQLAIGHIASSTDAAYFRVPVPAEGTHLSFYLSHIAAGADYDLAVFKPKTAPLQSAPLGGIPLGGIPLPDNGVGTSNKDTSLAPEALQDVPNVGAAPLGGIPLGGIPLGGIGQTRGNADELVQMTTGPETGYYTVQVTGYNGSFSNRPYQLRVKATGAAPVPNCPARSFPNAMGTPGPLPAAIAPTTKTILLVDPVRMTAIYGSAATTSMMSELSNLAGRTDVMGTVVEVEGNKVGQTSSLVRDAYAAWDRTPCSVDLANDVVRKVNAVVAGYRTDSSRNNLLPNLRYIVMLGSDEALPMARRADSTTISNESNETRDLSFLLNNSGTTQANALYAAAALGNYLTDDAYASFAPMQSGGQEIYLPTIAPGRLVETPAEITGQLKAYETAGGQLNPHTAVTTGYDFLTSGARSINASFGSLSTVGSHADGALINDTWNRNDLLGKLVPSGGSAPDIIAPNAHYNHYQLQPAAPVQGTTFGSGDLLGTADLPAAPGASPAQFSQRVLFTMGCHAGLNVPDSYLPHPSATQVTQLQDWTQYYAQQQAAVYVANTGYGYADTDTMALSSRLMSLFAQQFGDDSTNIGDKLVLAKRDYFQSMGQYGPYDEKALQEATFYGLPMYHLVGGGSVPAPTPPSTTTDPVTGLPVAALSFAPSLVRHDTARGTFWGAGAAGDQTQATLYRPIEPRLDRDVTVSGQVAHGVMIKGLSTGDVSGVTPALQLPTIDQSGHEPAPDFADQTYPADLVHLDQATAFGSTTQHLVVVAGQYRNQGIQRLLNSVSVEVAYSTSADTVAPLITSITAVRNGTAATITVRAVDDNTGVRRVGALYNDAGAWKYVELSLAGSNTWTASVTLSVAQDFELLAEAQDAAGNVGRSTNKGFNFHSNVTQVNLPSSLAAVGQLHQVALTWTAATTGSPVTAYKLYRGPSASNLALLATVSGSTLSYTDAGLGNGSTNTYAVAPTTATGDGPLSNGASASTYTLPTAPQNLAAAPGNAQVGLTWQVPASAGAPAISSYNVYRSSGASFVLIATAAGGSTSYTDSVGCNGCTFGYKVTAINPVGEGPASNIASATTFTTASAPQNLVAHGGPGAHQLSISWQAPASNGGSVVTAYRIYRGFQDDGGMHFSLLTTVGASASTYTDDTGCELCRRWYAVSAVNTVGEGPQSNQDNAITFTTPTAPQNLTLSAPLGTPPPIGEIVLNWQLPASNGDGNSQDPPLALQAYNIYRGVNGAAPTLYTSVSGQTTTFTDTGLTPLNSYAYYVAAVNLVGQGLAPTAPAPGLRRQAHCWAADREGGTRSAGPALKSQGCARR